MKRKALPESQLVFTFISASELLAKSSAVAKVRAPVVAADNPAPKLAVDACPRCEFAGDYVYPGASGRQCVDGTFCPARVYGNLALFQVCLTRLAKLKERREQS